MTNLSIDLTSKTKERLKYLISKQGDAEHLFKDFISYKISQLETAIFNIEKDLRKFEKKHKLSSVEFFEQFEAGKFGDEDDYMIWSGIYEMYLENKDELNKIRW